MYRDHKKAKVAKFVVGFLLFIALVPYVTMLLWNALMPIIFGIKSITYLQALGLIILSKILFSGFSHMGAKKHNHWRPQPEHVKKFQEKMKNMAEESKQKDHFKGPFGMNDQKG